MDEWPKDHILKYIYHSILDDLLRGGIIDGALNILGLYQ
jgi:hypothetical protein